MCILKTRMLAAFVVAFLAGVLHADPVKVIFDTDMGPDYDDVGAMAVLHTLADRGEAEILATVSCNRSPLSVACIEILNSHYGHWNIPVGCVGKGGIRRDKWDVKFSWREVLAANYPKFRHKVSTDAPDAVTVYRRALAEAPDGSVTIITVGFLTNPMRLLQSGPDDISPLDGETLVRKKVKQMVSMAGTFPKGTGEYNIAVDAAASQYVIAHWPTPILFSGSEIGGNVFTGKRLIAQQFPDNPVKDVYKTMMILNNGDPNGRQSWDQTAVLAAVRGPGNYFGVEHGTIRMNGGKNSWVADPDGPHARLLKKMEWKDLAAVIEDLMMAPPLHSHGI